MLQLLNFANAIRRFIGVILVGLFCVLCSVLDTGRPIALMTDAAGNTFAAKSISNKVVIARNSGEAIDQSVFQDDRRPLAFIVPDEAGTIITTNNETLSDVAYHVISAGGSFSTTTRYDDRFWQGAEYLLKNDTTANTISAVFGVDRNAVENKRINFLYDHSSVRRVNLRDVLAYPASFDGAVVILENNTDRGVFGLPGKDPLKQAEQMAVSIASANSGYWLDLNTLVIDFAVLAFFLFCFFNLQNKIWKICFVSVGVLIVGTQVLRTFGIYVPTGNALLITMVASYYIWDKRRRSTSRISGAPLHTNLTRALNKKPKSVFVAKVDSYELITEKVTDDELYTFCKGIVSKLQVQAGKRTIFEVGHGVYTWVGDSDKISDIDAVANGLHLLFSLPIGISTSLNTKASICIGVDTNQEEPVSSRIKSAQIASRLAEEQSLAWKASSKSDADQAARELTLKADIEAAIANGRIRIVVQPKYSLATQTVTGYEALARWDHDSFGPIPPNEFVAICETGGLINALTHSILEQVCDAIEQHNINVPISINISPKSLSNDALMNYLINSQNRCSKHKDLLCLELTENCQIEDSLPTRKRLLRLVEHGYALSIDDFGAGYGSMEYLKLIPAKELKIDRALISDVSFDEKTKMIVQTTIMLGKQMGLSIVCEGIETKEQETVLKQLGADTGQGYYFSKPVEVVRMRDFGTLPNNLLAS